MVQIQEKTLIHAPVERCFYLSLSIDLHQESTSQTRERAIEGRVNGLIGPGERVTWQGTHFGILLLHTSEITAYKAPVYFQDTMVKGVFKSFQHDHSFIANPDGTCMKDVMKFAVPIPLFGFLAETLVLQRYMRRFLRERNLFIKEIAESEAWRRYIPGM